MTTIRSSDENNGEQWRTMENNGEQWRTMENNGEQWRTMEKMKKMKKTKKATPIIVVAVLVLGSFFGCKPNNVPAKSTGSRLGSTGMAEGVTTEALIQALQKNGFEVVEGKTFEEIVPSDTPSRGNYLGLVALTDTSAKRPNEFVVALGPDRIIWFESHDISGDDAIKDWEAHVEKRIHLVERLANQQ